MFRGESEYNLDDKGRLLIPAKYREELGDVVMVGRGWSGQINVYPRPFFDELERRAAENDDANSFGLTARFLAAAVECEVDRQGRVMIPALLRRHARLETEVIVVGNRTHLEVWNPDLWQDTFQEWVKGFRASPDDYAKARAAGLQL